MIHKIERILNQQETWLRAEFLEYLPSVMEERGPAVLDWEMLIKKFGCVCVVDGINSCYSQLCSWIDSFELESIPDMVMLLDTASISSDLVDNGETSRRGTCVSESSRKSLVTEPSRRSLSSIPLTGSTNTSNNIRFSDADIGTDAFFRRTIPHRCFFDGTELLLSKEIVNLFISKLTRPTPGWLVFRAGTLEQYLDQSHSGYEISPCVTFYQKYLFWEEIRLLAITSSKMTNLTKLVYMSPIDGEFVNTRKSIIFEPYLKCREITLQLVDRYYDYDNIEATVYACGSPSSVLRSREFLLMSASGSSKNDGH